MLISNRAFDQMLISAKTYIQDEHRHGAICESPSGYAPASGGSARSGASDSTMHGYGTHRKPAGCVFAARRIGMGTAGSIGAAGKNIANNVQLPESALTTAGPRVARYCCPKTTTAPHDLT